MHFSFETKCPLSCARYLTLYDVFDNFFFLLIFFFTFQWHECMNDVSIVWVFMTSMTMQLIHFDFFFAGIFLSLLIFLSIAGNILVCLAIYTERSLRRIGNLFLASLAIADLFVASLVMTFAGVNDLLGAYFCEIRSRFRITRPWKCYEIFKLMLMLAFFGHFFFLQELKLTVSTCVWEIAHILNDSIHR